jgi:hypothetical protein
MPNAKHKEKVKETSDVLKDCREVLHDGSNEIVAQMLAFMNRVDKELDGRISMSQILVLIYQSLYKNHSFIIRRSWD